MSGPKLLSVSEIEQGLGDLPGWSRDGDALARTYECRDFAAALAFVVRAGFASEASNHHPDLDLRWRRVRVVCTTHDAGGVTERDLALAGALNRCAAGLEA